MAIFKNQHATKVISMLMACVIFGTSGFSVSAQIVSDENSTNTETQVREDIILPNGDKIACNENLTIDIVEAISVKIKVGNKDYKEYKVPQGTVAQALDHADIELGSQDTVNKKLTDEVVEGSKIKVNRVSFKNKTKTKKVAYKTVKKNSNKLYVGQTKVTQKGKKGVKKVTYTSKIVNGKVEKTYVSNTKVTKKAVKKVVLVGTKRKNYTMLQNNSTSFKTKSTGGAGTFIDHKGNKVAYTKKFTGKATAYSRSVGPTTATGDPVHIGGVAVDPNEIPYGSKLYIETTDGKVVYGYAVANDTGGFTRTSDTLCDLFYDADSTCINFGRRDINLYILA